MKRLLRALRLPGLPRVSGFMRVLRVPGFLRWVLVLGAASGVTALATRAPAWLARMDAFRVRRVEVVGARYLDPRDVVAAACVTPGASVFDDLRPVRARLARLRLVAEARVEPRLPGTLVLRVEEAEPVALASTPELVPVSAAAFVLPIGPGTADLDLPVLDVVARPGADGRLSDPTAIALTGMIARLRTLDPAVAGAVSEVQPGPGASARLIFRHPVLLEALVPMQPDANVLKHLRTAMSDVVARGELGRVAQLDARFVDQIVVAFTPQRP